MAAKLRTVTAPGGSVTVGRLRTAATQIQTSGRPDVVGSGYRLVNCIGRGGFGQVWKAEAPGGVLVAVKIISRPIDHQDAQCELQALELIKGLRHPYLLQTQAYWVQDDHLVIVMELADGSLRQRLKATPRGLPVDELVRYFRSGGGARLFAP